VRDGAHALSRLRRGEIRAAPRFSRTERRQRRPPGGDERREQARLLLGTATEQHREQSKHGTEESERDIGVRGVELLGQYSHVNEAGALPSKGGGHQAAKKVSLNRLLVERPRGRETLHCRAQVARRRANF
jgi:hypothetical protein